MRGGHGGARLRAAGLGLLLALLVLVPPALGRFGLYMLSLWCVYVVAAHGLNLTMGYAGQVSLGHAAFFGIGAYASALLVKAGLTFWLAMPLAALLCVGLGLAVGFPALRVQHHYLAFATLGFNALVWLGLRNEEWLTGGNFGVRDVARPSLAGLALDGSLAYYYLCLLAMVAMSAALAYVVASPWGRAFAALRDNPVRAASLGLDIRAYTLAAFAAGALYAGVAGALFAPLVGFIDPTPFGVPTSLAFVLAVVVGGTGRLAGPYLGIAVLILLPEWLRGLPGAGLARVAQEWYLVGFGAVVMAMMIWSPGGLLGLAGRVRRPRP
jgi:branched-chain amino acid transport system permease protein